MLNASSHTLKILSALFWYIGGIVLIFKGSRLVFEANELRPDQIWPLMAIIAGILLGGFKAIFLFSKGCQKNIERIDALVQPKIWEFFRLRFFVFLLLMIITGATLSKLAHNNYPLLIGVAVLDFSIAIALIGSSYVFWTNKNL